ncbi:MAG TPA: hypothetical protein VM120_25220 [Bryobacteraceae bacterium]|nr:hypothetical protein [Bryobacteraceae bacterium]
MIDVKTAEKQVKRLLGLSFLPPGKEAMAEVTSAMQCAETEADAAEIVRDCLDRTEFPKPADIRRIAFRLQENRKAEGWTPSDSTCVCEGTGFVHTRRMVNGIAYDYSARCTCVGVAK